MLKLQKLELEQVKQILGRVTHPLPQIMLLQAHTKLPCNCLIVKLALSISNPSNGGSKRFIQHQEHSCLLTPVWNRSSTISAAPSTKPTLERSSHLFLAI